MSSPTPPANGDTVALIGRINTSILAVGEVANVIWSPFYATYVTNGYATIYTGSVTPTPVYRSFSDAAVAELVNKDTALTRIALQNLIGAGGGGVTNAAIAAIVETGATKAKLDSHYAPIGAVGVNPDDVGTDIILGIGQSNMDGRGTGYSLYTDPLDGRIFQFPYGGANAATIGAASEPLVGQGGTPTGIGPLLQFARWYAGSVSPNRRILVVPAAKGGTRLGLSAEWDSAGSAGNLYNTAVAHCLAALAAAGPNSRIVAALWLQGESDGDASYPGASYQTKLDALIANLRTALGVPTLPFVIGQMVPDYLPIGTRGAINDVHYSAPGRVTRTAAALGSFGNSLGDGNHYAASGQRLMGRAMFDAYRRIMTAAANPAQPAKPGQTVGLAAASVTSTTLTLNWTATPNAARYYVEQRTGAGTWARIATPATNTLAVTGLTTATDYGFRVTPVSLGGPGTASVEALVTTTGGAVVAPGAPTALVLTPGNNQLTASWTAGSNGGGTITDYIVETSADGSTGWTVFADGTSTTAGAVITGLTNGTIRYVRVSAVNSAGTGPVSATASATPAAAADITPPTTPTTPVATAGAASASVTATGSTDANFAGYRVFSSADGYTTPVATSASSPIAVTGLTAGTAYTFKTAGYDAAGNQSALSAASNSVTPTASSAAVISDTFTSDATTLTTTDTGQSWTQLGGTADVIGKASGGATRTTTSGSSATVRSAGVVIPYGTSGRIRAVIKTPPSSTANAGGGIIWDCTSSYSFKMVAFRTGSSTSGYSVQQSTNSSSATVIFTPTPAAVPAAGDVIELIFSPTAWEFKLNGVSLATGANTTTKSSVGFTFGQTNTMELESFEVFAA